MVKRCGLAARSLERWRQKYLRRMWDLSEFMKTLKQKFTSWFNRTHERVGTLWESRFKSVLVEGSWGCLLKVAAYIDLNALRAGMVEDPKDYRWCGYGEAVAGDRRARRGLVTAMRSEVTQADWRHVRAAYRKLIFGIGEENSARPGISRERWQRYGRAGESYRSRNCCAAECAIFLTGWWSGQRGLLRVFLRRDARCLALAAKRAPAS